MYSRFKPALLISALVFLSLILSACNLTGQDAPPTPSLQELQMTAQAAAAATLTAQAPVVTEAPPTEPPTATPEPSPSPEPVVVVQESLTPEVQFAPPPIQPEIVVAAATEEQKSAQDCGIAVISPATEGPRAPVSILNKKDASITLSYYLEPSPFGQCGSGSVSFSGDVKTLNLPVGCYWLYAWVTYKGKDESFQGYSCLSKKGNIRWAIFPDRMEEVKN